VTAILRQLANEFATHASAAARDYGNLSAELFHRPP
jgi:hypothetical protein